jgi:mevalonate kinase
MGGASVAHSPGKLILSGEHSVLYGAPALAMALAQYTEVRFVPQGPGAGLRTAFENLSSGVNYPLQLLHKLKSSLDDRFDQFKRGELKVQEILTHPDDLAVYTLASLLQDQDGSTGTSVTGIGAVGHLPHPGQLSSRSSIPIGAGLGSSAAVVAAVTVLFETLLNRHKTLEDRYERVRFCERLKHGKAGPIDAAAVVRGGLVHVGGAGLSVPSVDPSHGLAEGDGWYWVLHGRPDSSTGECVAHVRAHHGSDTALWRAFGTCTDSLAQALSDGADVRDLLRENHSLLEHIGVVPEPAQDFARAVSALGGAAKVCGAGSVQGSGGGAILVRLSDSEAMESLMQDHPDKAWSKLRMATTGASAGPAPQMSATIKGQTV